MKQNKEEKEIKTIISDLETVITFYEEKLEKLDKSSDTAQAPTAVRSTSTETNDNSFFHDIKSDRELSASECERIRHGGEFSFGDFFRSILMANEPAQRKHS